MSDDEHVEYDDQMIIKLELAFGAKGFLSPGGPEEVAAIIDGIDIHNKTVLDIGAGVGGPACLLAEEHGAAYVTGIDIEKPVLTHARRLAETKQLANKVEFRLVEPGPLDFKNDSFDIVFSKDSIIHIPNKLALFKEALRVLKPGGWLVMSDWCCSDGNMSAEMAHWIEVTNLNFAMKPLGESQSLLDQAGFINTQTQDRSQWFIQFTKEMVERLGGPVFDRMAKTLGADDAEKWLERAKLRALVASQGQLRPGHLRGQKN